MTLRRITCALAMMIALSACQHDDDDPLPLPDSEPAMQTKDLSQITTAYTTESEMVSETEREPEVINDFMWIIDDSEDTFSTVFDGAPD